MFYAKNIMRKLLAGLLLCALFLSVAPFSVAAEEQRIEAENLYVTDGLVFSLSAFDLQDASVDLSLGAWYSTVGESAAFLAGGAYHPTENPTGWQMGEAGGLTYRFSSLAEFNQSGTDVGIVLPASVLSDGDFALEAVFRPEFIKDKKGELVTHNNETSSYKWGAYTGARSFLSVAGLQWCFFQPSSYNAGTVQEPSYSGASMPMRQFYYKAPWDETEDKVSWTSSYPFGTYSVDQNGKIKNEILEEVFTLSLNRAVSSGAEYTRTQFEITLGENSYTLTNGDGTDKTDDEKNRQRDFYALSDCAAPCELFFGLPSTVYAIRVYDRTLSKEEKLQNACADIIRYTGADTSAYFAMPESVRKTVHQEVVSLGFDAGAEAVNAAILAAKEIYDAKEAERLAQEKERAELLEDLLAAGERDKYDKYYVQSGLWLFLDGFASMHEWNTDIDLEAGTWHSKVGDASATLGGASYWRESPDGRGIEYRMTKEEYLASCVDGVCPVDISFDPALLPQNFTVETVAKFVGLTNEDGTRYEDPATSPNVWGIYTGNYSSFSFGPLKSMNFLCISHVGTAASLETRWCYTPKEWKDHNGGAYGVGMFRSFFVKEQDPTVPATLAVICHHPNSETATIQIYENNVSVYARSTTRVGDPEPEFHLFKGLAATVYAVRVYSRALSVKELSQNHMADLLSYYHLDTALLDLALSCVDITDLAPAFDDLDFDMTREEAENAVNTRILNTWLSFEGFSVRLGDTPGVRAVFTLNEEGLRILEESGFTLEIGVLLRVGGDAAPTLADAPYRVVFLAAGERNEKFFIDRESAAFAVDFQGFTPEMSIDMLHFAAYLKMTDKSGRETVGYVAAGGGAEGANLLSAYETALLKEEYAENAFLLRTYNNCFEYQTIYVDPDNGSDGNDGVTAPVKTLERAIALLLSLLEGEAPVDATLRFSEGKHRIAEHIALDAADIQNPYYRLHFIGEAGDISILTGSVAMENNNFQQVAGEAYYAYHFEKDSAGNYPDFRYFFVDGLVQEIAHHGYNRTAEAETEGGIDLMWKLPYHFSTAEQPTAGIYRLYLPKAALADLDGNAFAGGKVELHTPIAWYYRVMHLDNLDLMDEREENLAVYIRPEEVKYIASSHGFQGQYFWLANSLAFLDEPGEFYYDDAEGILYYYPAEGVDMEYADFEYSVTGHLLSFEGISRITFENLVFTGNDDTAFDDGAYIGNQATTSRGDFGSDTLSALYFANARNVTVKNCLFHDLSTTALQFSGGTENVKVDSCRFEKIGSSALFFGAQNGIWNEKTNANRNIEICNNYLEDIAWHTRGSVGIFVNVADGLEIRSNTILQTSYSAISVGWRWETADWAFGENIHLKNVDIHHNYFAGFMTDQSDGGAVYTLGGNVAPEYHEQFNELHDNFAYFDENTWDGKGIVMPYYHDGASSNWYTYYNVVLLTPGRSVYAPIYLQNVTGQLVHNILVRDNDIIGHLKPKEMYLAGEEWDPLALEYVLFGEDTGSPRPDAAEVGYQYYSRVSEERYNRQYNNMLHDDPVALLEEGSYVLDVINAAGSSFCRPDAEALLAALQPLYDAWWAE